MVALNEEARCETLGCTGHVKLQEVVRLEWYDPDKDKRHIKYAHFCSECRDRIFNDSTAYLSINGGGS